MSKLTPRSRAAVLALATGAGRAAAATSRAKPRHLESREQRLFVQRWRLDPRTRDLPACAIPNGVRTSAIQAKLAKADGMSAGAPDWLCFAPGRGALEQGFRPDLRCVGIALEVKSPTGKGKLSPAQVEWHDRLRANGWRVEVVTSAEAAWAVVVDYLGLPG